jgi:hypothetical protein
MLVIIGALLTLASVVIASRLWAPSGADAGGLGWMSEGWLAEQRASHGA